MAEIMVEAQEVLRDEGTIVVFKGVDQSGTEVVFVADHRMARDIVEALRTPGEMPPQCFVPGWAILSIKEA